MNLRKAVVENRRDEFCKIEITDFIQYPNVEYDVFMRVADNRFLKVGYANSTLEANRLQSFRELGLKYLYVRHIDVAFEVV